MDLETLKRITGQMDQANQLRREGDAQNTQSVVDTLKKVADTNSPFMQKETERMKADLAKFKNRVEDPNQSVFDMDEEDKKRAEEINSAVMGSFGPAGKAKTLAEVALQGEKKAAPLIQKVVQSATPNVEQEAAQAALEKLGPAQRAVAEREARLAAAQQKAAEKVKALDTKKASNVEKLVKDAGGDYSKIEALNKNSKHEDVVEALRNTLSGLSTETDPAHVTALGEKLLEKLGPNNVVAKRVLEVANRLRSQQEFRLKQIAEAKEAPLKLGGK